MEHLTIESLARLVDERPTPEEAAHVAHCERCRDGLATLRDQTERLRSLPDLLVPPGDWDVLEARMRSEGLIADRGALGRLRLARTPAWMRGAAAVLLFLAGTGTGALVSSRGEGAALDRELVAAGTVEDARTLVREAEGRYVRALTHYRQLVSGAIDEEAGDPAGRYAALEYLVAAGQAAVRQAPADPFLNGLLASTLAEREATLRRISSSGDTWF